MDSWMHVYLIINLIYLTRLVFVFCIKFLRIRFSVYFYHIHHTLMKIDDQYIIFIFCSMS